MIIMHIIYIGLCILFPTRRTFAKNRGEYINQWKPGMEHAYVRIIYVGMVGWLELGVCILHCSFALRESPKELQYKWPGCRHSSFHPHIQLNSSCQKILPFPNNSNREKLWNKVIMACVHISYSRMEERRQKEGREKLCIHIPSLGSHVSCSKCKKY